MAIATVETIEGHVLGWPAAESRLERMLWALEHMHEPLQEIVSDVREHTLEQFETRGAISGDEWEHLAASTIASKEREHYPAPEWPLVASGELMASATTDAGEYSEGETLDSEAWLGVDWERDGYQIGVLHQQGVPWTEVHRRAYTRADGTHVAGASYMWHLPSRPIFTVTDELADKGAERIVAHVFNPLS
jgi:hypothetical protein